MQVEPCELVLQPGAEASLQVCVLMDEAGVAFRDTLRLLVEDGQDAAIPLEAVGAWAWLRG